MKQMNTKEPENQIEQPSLSRETSELEPLHARIAPHFQRSEVRARARHFLKGLLGRVERKNGWQLAEEEGESGPQGMQRLLNAADWDEEAVRDELRGYVLEHLQEKQSVLVIDETGFVKKGKKSAGVARQYSGTAGRRENSQVGVFLLYASRKGAAFIDRELYLPEEWTTDRVRCREAGIPDQVEFATKGNLAKQMLVRAFAAGVKVDWVLADTVYGYDEMRKWLEEQWQPYVLAVPETHQVWSGGELQEVRRLAALFPVEAWAVLSAGEGSQGARLYEWAWMQLPYTSEGKEGWSSWVVVRRSLSHPEKRAYYRAWGPAMTPLTTLVQAAGSRWKIEEGYEQAKGEVGLDQYEVRRWRAWYRFMTLALLAHAFLVVLRAQQQDQEQKKGSSNRYYQE
jgi:SRSO17 transposase